MAQPSCVICEHDHTTFPEMILARWQDQDICTDCLENRPGKAEAEREAAGLTVLSQQEYREMDGGCCPRCHRSNFEAGRMNLESGLIGQRMRCLDCALTWEDMYRLAGYVREKGPDGDADWAAFLDTKLIDALKGA